jgi:AAA15 family ATPase/GTPase
MLVGFTVENWKSFRDPVSFSMIKTRERQHSERIPRLDKYDIGVLPVAAIYGGNASGKTNLFSALRFMKEFVVKQRAPEERTGVTPFLLSDETRVGLTKFTARILTSDDVVYELSFSLDEKHVDEEELIRVDGKHERVLYQRKAGKKGIPLDDSLGLEKPRLKVIFQGTQDNQLFITNSIFQKCDAFRQVYDWFAKTLQLISPTARYLAPEKYVNDSKMAQMLQQLDTGIVDLGTKDATIGDLDMPSQAMDLVQKDLVDGKSVALRKNLSGSRFVVSKGAEGGLSVRELVTHHQREGNKATMDFHMSQESDGTQRLMDLLPAFLDISSPSSRRVYVVDELDRSLHTLLTRSLVESYLGCCSVNSRAQFIFTTHDALLMDQRLLRRDEIWVTERKSDGSSDLFSFSDYKDARKDKDIRKSYLQGRLGGVPRIFLDDMLGCPSPGKPHEAKDGRE